MKSSFLETGIHFKWSVLIFLVIISIVAAVGLPKLTVDTSMDSLIANDEPMRPDYDRVIEEFGSDRTTIIYLKDVNLWSPEKLAIIDEIHYALQDLDFVSKVDSLYTATSIRDVDGTLDSDTVLLDPPTDLEEIAQAKDNALYSPLLRKNFISDDGIVTAINVTLKPSSGPEFDQVVTNSIENIIAPHRNNFEKIFAVGSPRIATEMNKSLLSDLSWLGPAAAGVLMATIIVFLRSGFAAFVPLVSAGLAIVWTFGFMGWLGIPMNILSAMLPTLIVVIGATEDTHMLSVYLASLKEKETIDKHKKRRDAAIVMARHVGIPVILTTLTTFMGFASNGFSAIGMIKDFAFASAFGVASNGLITILFVPLILNWFGPLKTKIISEDKEISGIQGLILHGLNYLRKEHPGKVMIITILLFSFCLFKAFDLKVSNAPLTYFKKGHPLVVQNEDIHNDLSGTKIFYIAFESGEQDTFKQPENLNKLVEIKKLITKQGKFDQAVSIIDHLSLVNREWSEGDPDEFRPPQMPMLVDQYLLFFQKRDIENYINHDFSSANMVVRHNIQESYQLKILISELDEEISSIIDGGFSHVFVGEDLMINNAADRLMAAQVGSIGLLLAVIVLMMSILFTSWRGGAISLIPNLIPIVWAFGLMSILNIPINPGTATVAVIAIGIAIDDTIHLLSKFNEESRTEIDRDIAVEKTVRYEAIPVISTSISLMAGFAVLVGVQYRCSIWGVSRSNYVICSDS